MTSDTVVVICQVFDYKQFLSLFDPYETSTPSLTPSPSSEGRGEQALALRDKGTLEAEQRAARSAG